MDDDNSSFTSLETLRAARRAELDADKEMQAKKNSTTAAQVQTSSARKQTQVIKDKL